MAGKSAARNGKRPVALITIPSKQKDSSRPAGMAFPIFQILTLTTYLILLVRNVECDCKIQNELTQDDRRVCYLATATVWHQDLTRTSGRKSRRRVLLLLLLLDPLRHPLSSVFYSSSVFRFPSSWPPLPACCAAASGPVASLRQALTGFLPLTDLLFASSNSYSILPRSVDPTVGLVTDATRYTIHSTRLGG